MVIVLAGCGGAQAASPAAPRPSAVEVRLGRIAFAQARAAGNAHPLFARYVAAQRRRGVQVSEGGEIVGSNEPVWVVEVVGPFPRYERFSVPPGVNPSMSCQAISFTVERGTWAILDSGCGPAFRLSRLGRARGLAPPARPA
jgi:hypothetical protein